MSILSSKRDGRKLRKRVKKSGLVYRPLHLVDLMDQSSIERAASEVIKATNDKVDVLINNAAVQYVGPLIEMDMSLVRESFETNVLGPLAFTQLVAKGMMRRRTGRIVNVGSPSGWSVCPWQVSRKKLIDTCGYMLAPTFILQIIIMDDEY